MPKGAKSLEEKKDLGSGYGQMLQGARNVTVLDWRIFAPLQGSGGGGKSSKADRKAAAQAAKQGGKK
jgi:hypothetical protein